MSEPSSQVTFRDFAGAIMGSDVAGAARTLETLLGLEASAALAATTHFQSSISADPSFMMKAMGLRTAVTSGSDDDIRARLTDCFGLAEPAARAATLVLRTNYPAS
jgi:hypothetical protein